MFFNTVAAPEKPAPQTKFAQDSDLFEVMRPIAALRPWFQINGNRAKSVITRAELKLSGVKAIAVHCLERSLKPLTETAPEQFGLTPEEALTQFLPDTKDLAHKFARLFQFFEDPAQGQELKRLCPVYGDQFTTAAFNMMHEQVTPATLPVILQAAFAECTNEHIRTAGQLAFRFLLECNLRQFTGKGAWPAMETIAYRLMEFDNRDEPNIQGALAVRLFQIIAANKPARTKPLYDAVVRFTRLNPEQWPQEVRAADQTYYELFVA